LLDSLLQEIYGQTETKMALCKYFSSGTCKFGNNCRNKHEVKKIDSWQINTNNYKHESRTYKLQNLKLPPAVNDNLSRDFKWDVPSPTVQSDKNFFSSDSDFDEKYQTDQEVVANNFAIVACQKCGFKELKLLPTIDAKNLCLKCKDMPMESIKSKDDLIEAKLVENKENGDHGESEMRRRKKRKKKKLPFTETNNIDELYEGTPEGVKVYRSKEEANVSNDIPVKSIAIRGNFRSKKNKKPPLLSNQTSSATLEPPTKIEIIEVSCDEDEEVLNATEDVPESSKEKDDDKHWYFSFISLVLIFSTLSEIFRSLITKFNFVLVEFSQVIKSLCLTAFRAVTGSKSTKYSRRRRILK